MEKEKEYTKKRYFLVAYNYTKGAAVGFGNMYFQSDDFPQMKWLKGKASEFSGTDDKNIVIISIQEFNEEDYKTMIS